MFEWFNRLCGSQAESQSPKRNAYCAFCRQSYRDAGPLVEGPGDVFICERCVELCQSILTQEKTRRAEAAKSN